MKVVKVSKSKATALAKKVFGKVEFVQSVEGDFGEYIFKSGMIRISIRNCCKFGSPKYFSYFGNDLNDGKFFEGPVFNCRLFIPGTCDTNINAFYAFDSMEPVSFSWNQDEY